MYVEATVENSDDIIYGDYPSLKGLDVGTRIPLSKLNPTGENIVGEYEILSREQTTRRDTTQVDPEKVRPMIKLRLRRIY